MYKHEKGILKSTYNRTNTMSIKRKFLIILFAIVLTAGMAGGFIGCTKKSSKENLKTTVSFDGMDYVLQEDIGLNLYGFDNSYEGLAEICEKVGSINNVDIYKIKGLDQSEWILVDNNPMLSSGEPYGGIYRSVENGVDSISEFNPDYLGVYYLTPPTSEQSGIQLHMFSTADSNVLEEVVKAIANGKPVTDKKQEEVTKAMLTGDGSYKNYRLEFLSDSFPKLVYRLNYAEDGNGKFYIGYYGDITDYRIFEIDSTLHEYLVNASVGK